MKRFLFLIFLVVNVNGVFAQAPDTLNKPEKKLHWLAGVEFNFNEAYKNSYQRNGVYSLNAFYAYNKHELYSGFDVTGIKRTKHRLWGFEMGYKYHFRRRKKMSNIYLDLNYQCSKYVDNCAMPQEYNYIPEPWDVSCYFNKVRSNILSIGPGYEFYITPWFSATAGLLPGINWGELDPMPFYAGRGAIKRDFIERAVLVKFSLRFSLPIKSKGL